MQIQVLAPVFKDFTKLPEIACFAPILPLDGPSLGPVSIKVSIDSDEVRSAPDRGKRKCLASNPRVMMAASLVTCGTFDQLLRERQ